MHPAESGRRDVTRSYICSGTVSLCYFSSLFFSFFFFFLKEHCAVLQNLNIFSVNEIIIQTRKCLFLSSTEKNELFSEENKAPGTLLEAREVAGSATNEQSKTA